MKKLLLFFFGVTAWAGVAFTSGSYGNTTLSGSPFSTLASWHYEFRLDAWTMPSPSGNQVTIALIEGGRVRLYNTSGVAQLWWALDADGPNSGEALTLLIPNATYADAVIRLHKDATNSLGLCPGFSGCAIMEVWTVQGGSYQVTTLGLTSPTSTIAGGLQIGDGGAATYGFSRIFPGVGAVGAQPPYQGASTTGVVSDYEFASMGALAADSSGYANNLTFSGSAAYATMPLYNPACVLPSQLSFRSTSSGGSPTTAINGSLSYPLNGGSSLTYAWSLITPDNLGFSAPTTPTFAQPSGTSSPLMTLGNTGFGSYTVQLTVTDSSSQSSSCSQKYGAVNSDANGNVIFSTLPAPGPAHGVILGGNAIASYANPWPQAETLGVQFAQNLMQRMAGTSPYYYQYVPYWDVPQAGTVTVTAGSSTITGSGTNFANLYCGGATSFPASPATVNAANPQIVVFYNIGSPIGYSGTVTGRWPASVTACNSPTSISVSPPFPYTGSIGSPSANPYFVAGSGYSYAYMDQGGQSDTGLVSVASYTASATAPVVTLTGAVPSYFQVDWHIVFSGTSCAALNNPAGFPISAISGSTITLIGSTSGCPTSTGTAHSFGGVGGVGYSSSPMDYYDCALGFYSFWYRYGIDDYLVAARQMADTWFDWPGLFDKGNAFATCDGNDYNGCTGGEPRVYSLLGIQMRALEYGYSGGPSFDYWPGIHAIVVYGNGYTFITNPTNFPGDIRDFGLMTSFNAVDALYNDNPTNAAASLTTLETAMTNWSSTQTVGGLANGVWLTSDTQPGYNSSTQSFTANVTVGSSVVTANGGTWTSANFPVPPANTPSTFIFTNQGTNLATSNSQGDATWYYATYTDGSHLKLTDISGNAVNYVASTNCASGTCTGLGWETGALSIAGVQPFFDAHLSRGFYYASLALASASPTQAAFAKTGALALSNFTSSVGINYNGQTTNSVSCSPIDNVTCFPVNGPYYGRVYTTCETPTVAANPFCDAGLSADRLQSAEAMPIASFASLLTPTNATAKTIGDLLMASMWACNSSNIGYTGYCAGSNTNYGPYLSYQYSAKWFGFAWGLGSEWAWPSVRQGSGGVAPGSIMLPKTISLPGSIARLGRGAFPFRLHPLPPIELLRYSLRSRLGLRSVLPGQASGDGSSSEGSAVRK